MIPDFQALMLPLLKLAADGKEHTYAEAIERLADDFKLSDKERAQLNPSGRARTFNNRVGWAKTYLSKTGVLENVGRGRFKIGARGRDVLKEKPASIGLKYLDRFPELAEFRGRKDDAPEAAVVADRPETPEEVLDASYWEVRAKLAAELLERVKACTDGFFETLVVDLLVAMGYGGSRKDAGQAVGRSGDGGIDGIIKEDRLGLDAVYIQAKQRTDATIGRPAIQAFAGSLEGRRARKGVFITTTRFSPEAREYVERIEKRIVLIDGAELTQYMIDFGIGVSDVETYTVKKLDLDYFGGDE